MPSTLLAIPLTETNPPLAEQAEAAIAAGADIVELRVDCMADIGAVEDFLKSEPGVPTIVTARSATEGGQWVGTDEERISLIEKLGLLNPDFIDVELATWQQSANIRQKVGLVAETDSNATSRVKSRLILSYHDFKGTPTDLSPIFDAFEDTPAEVVKAVFTPADATDSCRVLRELYCRHRNRKVIALAMGEAGLIARVLARKFGGFLTFASANRGQESAPGQPTIEELRQLYRWDTINQDTKVFGVIGWPVSHSKSPLIHNAAMAKDDINGVYLPVPIRPDYADFLAFMDYVAANPWLGFSGFSVTIPHKEHAYRWLQANEGAVSPLAARCGAVNTLSLGENGKWSGDNTDAGGVLSAVGEVSGFEFQDFVGKKVTVLGAGGVARAIVAAFLEIGANVTIFNRTAGKAQQLAEEMGCKWEPWDQRGVVACDVLANGTSVGMTPEAEESPFPASSLCAEMLVFDTVYTPRDTRLIKDAQARGCATVTGEKMFIGQATKQYHSWHGQTPPIDLMQSIII